MFKYSTEIIKVITFKLCHLSYNVSGTIFNPLSANPTKWLNKLKQSVSRFLSLFDHFVGVGAQRVKRFLVTNLWTQTSRSPSFTNRNCSFIWSFSNSFGRINLYLQSSYIIFNLLNTRVNPSVNKALAHCKPMLHL